MARDRPSRAAPGGCRSRRWRASGWPWVGEPERSWDPLLGSRRSRGLIRCPQARVGRKRILDQHLAQYSLRELVRQHLVAFEMPVREVGREQQQVVAADVGERAG